MSQTNSNHTLIQSAIDVVTAFLRNLENSTIATENKKANLLSYWLKDYTKFLQYEDSFDPKRLQKYKRGDIIKVHFGFNVGSEEGGLHYAVVLDVDNHLSSPTVTVIPLTSAKEGQTALRMNEVSCGDRIYIELTNKIDNITNSARNKMVNLSEQLKMINVKTTDIDVIERNRQRFQDIHREMEILKYELKRLKKLKTEVTTMKHGSIALVGQITTISKIRIYDPKGKYDVLHGIRLSDSELDAIDNVIQNLFSKKVP